jgi:radical SAM enzyme (TIGR01210 family)
MPYPETSQERDPWIVSRRPIRNSVDPQRPYAFLIEQEPDGSGEIVSVATIFLTNRECPWRCLMCDLWQNTLQETVPIGAIPAQIEYALAAFDEPNVAGTQVSAKAGLGVSRIARQIKLYNSGSFFDPRAIPMADYEAIAQRVSGFERVIVECHPVLVNDSCLHFRDLLLKHAGHRSPASLPRLEIAMGLETVHPEVLPRLNKRMTLDQFSKAAQFLSSNGIDLRAFILVKPPFLDEAEGLYWAERSLDFAFQAKAAVASLIPTRSGNGALDALAEQGEFSPPKLSTLERAFSYGLSLKRGRVLADLWDLQKFSDCPACFQRRADRLSTRRLRELRSTWRQNLSTMIGARASRPRVR